MSRNFYNWIIWLTWGIFAALIKAKSSILYDCVLCRRVLGEFFRLVIPLETNKSENKTRQTTRNNRKPLGMSSEQTGSVHTENNSTTRQQTQTREVKYTRTQRVIKEEWEHKVNTAEANQRWAKGGKTTCKAQENKTGTQEHLTQRQILKKQILKKAE